PVAAFAPDGSLSETSNQLQSIGSELTSLRKDVRSLADELAQIRQAQEDLIVAPQPVRKLTQAQPVRKLAHAQPVRKLERPVSHTSGHRDNRGMRPTTWPPHP